MVRSRVLLSAIFATLGVALAGCAAPLSRGYYAGGYPYGIHGYYCGEWSVGRGYRVSMLVHLNGCIPRPRIRRSGVCAERGCPRRPSRPATPGARSPPPRPSTRGWSRRQRKANGQRTSKRRNRPSPWPMLRNATVSEEANHARFCSPAFRNRFHWWNG